SARASSTRAPRRARYTASSRPTNGSGSPPATSSASPTARSSSIGGWAISRASSRRCGGDARGAAAARDGRSRPRQPRGPPAHGDRNVLIFNELRRLDTVMIEIGARARGWPKQEPGCRTANSANQKGRPEGALEKHQAREKLLDLRFLELDVLARNRVVFLEGQLLCLGASVLLGDVEIARIGGRQELDLERGGLSHGVASLSFWRSRRRKRKKARGTRRRMWAAK